VQSTADYYLDVFNGITRRFATLLHDLDIPVYLYGSEEADCPVDELITCVTKKEQADWLGDVPYQHAWYDKANPMFAAFNARANAAIQKRKAPGDWICTIAGSANLPIWQQHRASVRPIGFISRRRGGMSCMASAGWTTAGRLMT
jgi:hypothetical protein